MFRHSKLYMGAKEHALFKEPQVSFDSIKKKLWRWDVAQAHFGCHGHGVEVELAKLVFSVSLDHDILCGGKAPSYKFLSVPWIPWRISGPRTRVLWQVRNQKAKMIFSQIECIGLFSVHWYNIVFCCSHNRDAEDAHRLMEIDVQ